MKSKFVPLILGVSLIVVSSFFVFAHVYVTTQLDSEHHPELLPNHPFLLIPEAYAIGTPPPLERVPASAYRITDTDGNTIDGLVNVGEQIQIQTDLANAQDVVQSLVYIVEVYDEDDTQVFRGWLEATLEPMTAFSPAVSWIPEKPGYYFAKMMIWEALDNSSALSVGLEAEFTVVGNMNALHENRGCGEGKEVVFKINFKKAACVSPETLVQLLARGWASWHEWYSGLLINNLREGPQDIDDVHSEFIKQEIMKNTKVSDYFLHTKKYDFTCCSYQYNEDDVDRKPRYQLAANISDLPNKKQLVVVYDLSQTKVVDTKLKDMTQLGGPITSRLEPVPQNAIQIIIPKGASDSTKQKNFVVIQEQVEHVDYLFFINQDDAEYEIRGIPSSGTGNGDFIMHISPHDDWKIPIESVDYVDLTGHDPDTGESYYWLDKRVSVEAKPFEHYFVDPADHIAANNQFAVDFYSKISQNNENIFYSPTSISTAFSILYEGAQEDTAKEIQQVFGLPENDLERQHGYYSLHEAINEKSSKGLKLRIANALWLAENFEPLKEYVNTATTFYDSTVSVVDFISDDGVTKINNWVKEKTENKIEELLMPGSTGPSTRMAITNAIYFKGLWEYPFDPVDTYEGDFIVNSEKTVTVPMMTFPHKMRINSVFTQQMKMIELPYKNNTMSMLVILPNDMNNLKSVEDSVTLENLESWTDTMRKIDTVVHIPKFSLETNYNLMQSLKDMGMPLVFDAGRADLSGITGHKGLFVSQAIHKAFVDVNEEGTEAAAATAIVLDESGGQLFKADHPFIFIIQDNETGQILFMGRVMDPTG